MGEIIKLEVTTNSAGAGTASANVPMRLIYKVEWDKGTFDSGVDATLTNTGKNGTSTTLLTLTDANSDGTYYLRLAEADNAGAALTTTSPPLVSGSVTLTIASGGDTKTGALYLHCLEA